MLKWPARWAILALVGGTGSALAAGPDLREGEWDTSYPMEVLGKPFPMPPITMKKTVFLSQKEAPGRAMNAGSAIGD